MSFGQKLQEARKNSGLTQKQLGEAVGSSKSTITSWETGARQPDIPMIKKLTQVLNVSAEFLLEIEKAPAKAETIHIDNTMRQYAALDDYGKRAVAALTEIEFERCTKSGARAQFRATRSVQLSLLPASAGAGTFLGDNYSESLDIPDIPEYRQVDFAVRVSGDSMEPVYSDGDIVLVREQPAVEFGEIGIFTVGNDGYIKEQGVDRLISKNPAYADIHPSEYDYVKCWGKVVGKLN